MMMDRREPLRIPDQHPMRIFSNPRLTSREKKLRQEVDGYVISEVEGAARLLVGKRTMVVDSSVDLPDAVCDGFTFKRRLVLLDGGNCYLLARWKPDRYMRRSANGQRQKWFIDRQCFPTNAQRFMADKAAQAQEAMQAGED
ncbi:MAG TPA: hypothetical protein VM221_05605 [Armatimonadota bacterium]|nr:hypothetical protein [Armatimonadota bacterium]